MKKPIFVLMCLFILSGCASTKPTEENKNAQPSDSQQVTEAPSVDASDNQNHDAPDEKAEIEKESAPAECESTLHESDGLLDSLSDTVVFTIPAGMFDDDDKPTTLGDHPEDTAGVISVTENEDGSCTIVLTKAKHAEMMQEIAKNIDDNLQKMIDPETMPTLVGISAQNNYTEFIVTISSNEVGLQESIAALSLYIYGGMYNIFNGTPTDDVSVYFVNQASGEIIQDAHSKDVR